MKKKRKREELCNCSATTTPTFTNPAHEEWETGRIMKKVGRRRNGGCQYQDLNSRERWLRIEIRKRLPPLRYESLYHAFLPRIFPLPLFYILSLSPSSILYSYLFWQDIVLVSQRNKMVALAVLLFFFAGLRGGNFRATGVH